MAVTYAHESLDSGNARVITVTAAGGDTSANLEFGQWADASVQVFGTFGTSTVSIEGSNNGTDFAVLNDAQGQPLSGIATPKIEQIVETTRFKRVVVTAGTGNVTVIFYMLRAQQLRV